MRAKNLKKDSIFSQNQFGDSTIIDFATSEDKNALLIITKITNIKPYALVKVTCENGFFIHHNLGSYFDENGAYKYWTIEQGLKWSGGEVFDDYC